MTTYHFRRIECFAIATVELDDGSRLEFTCQFPGGRPCRRTVPYNRNVRDYVEDAPVCDTFAEFEAWLHATYGE